MMPNKNYIFLLKHNKETHLAASHCQPQVKLIKAKGWQEMNFTRFEPRTFFEVPEWYQWAITTGIKKL